MTQQPPLAGRPSTGGLLAPELRIALIRSHARRLILPALILIGVVGASGYFFNNLPEPVQDWMLPVAAITVIFLFSFIPFLVWWTHTYIFTTRRVIERRGIFRPRRHELEHVRGYTIQVRRGLIQRMWRTGTLTLTGDDGDVIRLKNVHHVYLLHEMLSDQIEINQILAHRDGRTPTQFLPSSS